MKLTLYRYAHGKDSTAGILRDSDGNFLGYVVEDEFRERKVAGETRIPAGKYEIKFRKVASPKTANYRQRFDWFNWHLELQNVPGFDYVYIHVGNDDDDTEGCLLTGWQAYRRDDGEYTIGRSTDCFRSLYAKLRRDLDSEVKCTITITNL